MASERFKEALAIAVVGDGVVASVQPRRQSLLWRNGPRAYREMMEEFAARPGMTRALSAAQIGFGIWLASRQRPR